MAAPTVAKDAIAWIIASILALTVGTCTCKAQIINFLASIASWIILQALWQHCCPLSQA